MHPASLAVLLIFGLPIIIVVGIVYLLAVRMSGGRARGAEMNEEETRMIQEIHQGLMRMEERIEALETIMMEQDRKEGPR
jgi:phage shock protein B